MIVRAISKSTKDEKWMQIRQKSTDFFFGLRALASNWRLLRISFTYLCNNCCENICKLTEPCWVPPHLSNILQLGRRFLELALRKCLMHHSVSSIRERGNRAWHNFCLVENRKVIDHSKYFDWVQLCCIYSYVPGNNERIIDINQICKEVVIQH